jgi:hypothetical protein
MAKAHLKLVTPTTVNRTVTARRPPNAELRTREHLTQPSAGADRCRRKEPPGSARRSHASDLSAGRRDFIFANSEGATSAAEKSNEKNFTDADGCYKVNDVRASLIQSPFKLSPYQKHWTKEGSRQRLLHSD